MDTRAQIERLKEEIREHFVSMSKLYPEFSEFILQDCIPEGSKSVFDVVETSTRVPWFPYLKVSGGSDHDRSGEFFYTRPAWKGNAEDVKYRYLGKEVEAYVVGRAIYDVEYDMTKKRVVSRFVPKGLALGDGSRRYTVRVLYLATPVREVGGYGIVVVEGIRSKISVVSKIWDAIRESPVRVVLRSKKESGSSGVYWGMEVADISDASWDVLPFQSIVASIREYYDMNKKLRELMLFDVGSTTAAAEEVMEEDDIDTEVAEERGKSVVSERKSDESERKPEEVMAESSRKEDFLVDAVSEERSIFEDEDDEIPF